MWKSCEKALNRVSTGLRKENFHVVFFFELLEQIYNISLLYWTFC